MTTKRKEIAAYMKAHRNISQKALAEKIGSNQETLSRIENGRVNFSVDVMANYLEAVGAWGPIAKVLKKSKK